MKNADTPAFPQANDEIAKSFMAVEKVAPNGLTKRERYALAAMQGLCTKDGYHRWDLLAADAVDMADALLARLEEDRT